MEQMLLQNPSLEGRSDISLAGACPNTAADAPPALLPLCIRAQPPFTGVSSPAIRLSPLPPFVVLARILPDPCRSVQCGDADGWGRRGKLHQGRASLLHLGFCSFPTPVGDAVALVSADPRRVLCNIRRNTKTSRASSSPHLGLQFAGD
jgi:hypothetical protein